MFIAGKYEAIAEIIKERIKMIKIEVKLIDMTILQAQSISYRDTFLQCIYILI